MFFYDTNFAMNGVIMYNEQIMKKKPNKIWRNNQQREQFKQNQRQMESLCYFPNILNPATISFALHLVLEK